MKEENRVADISACVSAIVIAFRECSVIIDRLKIKCAEDRAAPPPRLLEESIDQAPDALEEERFEALVKHGKAFEEGDPVAIMALQQIGMDLQNGLLESLRNVNVDTTEETYSALVDSADYCRERAISLLRDLDRRLDHREPETGVIASNNVGSARVPLEEAIGKTGSLASPDPGSNSESWTDGLPEFQWRCEFDSVELR